MPKDSVVETQDQISIEFDGVFSRASYTEVTRRLLGTPVPSILSINLKNITYANATGVVPLIALERYLRAQGTLVDISFPHDSRYWEIAGWKQLLQGDDAPPIDAGRTYIPVQSYSDFSRLNDIVGAVLEVLVRRMRCSPGVLDSIAWTLNELADNVLSHSAEPGGTVEGFMQVVSHPNLRTVDLVVSDYGRGIRKSLEESHSTENDEEAILKAIQAGVTRDRAEGQGNGLAGSVRIVSTAGGELTIMSGNAELNVVNGNSSTRQSGAVPGTSVSLVLPTDVEINISSALWGTRPIPEFEVSHLGDANEIAFRVAAEASGFGNRETGRQLRTKLQNLMEQFPESRVEVDFDDIGLISASFADEFIAKLVVEMGNFSFFTRITVTNTNGFISQTLDNVIRQRSQPGHSYREWPNEVEHTSD